MPDDGVDHHEHDTIVELCSVPSRFEADVIVAKLAEAGIRASVTYAEVGGYLRGIGLMGGNHVLVFDCDLERANAMLDEDDEPTAGASPVAPPPTPRPTPTGRGRRRR